MLIRSRKIWLFLWVAVLAFVLYSGFTDGWTPLRIVSCVMLGLSVALNIAGIYYNQGLLRHMDKMSEEQLAQFLSRHKERDQSLLRKRLEAYRSTVAHREG